MSALIDPVEPGSALPQPPLVHSLSWPSLNLGSRWPLLHWARSMQSSFLPVPLTSASALTFPASSPQEDSPFCLHLVFFGILSGRMSFIPGDLYICLSRLRSVLTVPAITVAIAPPGCSRIPSNPNCAEHSSPQGLQIPLPHAHVLAGIPFVHAATPSTYPSSRFQSAQHSRCLGCTVGTPG